MREEMIFYTNELIAKKIINSTKDYKMLFIGENPHYNENINDLVVDLSIELAKKTDYKTYAKESLYCLYPFLEEDSKLGNESKIIPKKITEYNRSVEPVERITVTAVDLAHSIKHSPHLVNNFIQKQITDIENANFKDEISTLSTKIKDNFDKISKDKIIIDLKKLLENNIEGISQTVFEELSFYFELLSISLPLDDLNDKSQAIMRNDWFIKTIGRALKRNQPDRKMLLHVGSPHAYKFYLNNDDYYVGEIPEASYFKNKVYSIQIRPFYFGKFGELIDEIVDPIEKKALAMLGRGKSVFVDLHEYNDQTENIGIEKYFLNGEYQYDGIIYVNDKDEA
jgi:hypothetical protein